MTAWAWGLIAYGCAVYLVLCFFQGADTGEDE